MCPAPLVQQLVPGRLRLAGQAGAQVPSQLALAPGVQHRFHHVREWFVVCSKFTLVLLLF